MPEQIGVPLLYGQITWNCSGFLGLGRRALPCLSCSFVSSHAIHLSPLNGHALRAYMTSRLLSFWGKWADMSSGQEDGEKQFAADQFWASFHCLMAIHVMPPLQAQSLSGESGRATLPGGTKRFFAFLVFGSALSHLY